ncbi:hypothetical protein B9G54_00245 [Alloscardovia macacae]|uniref:DUF881 domain-containing protein n=1 Tax=Alloscardovia macacae TaxID=1160091 RepID=A0A1Y2SYC7_9BIFI|nr:DUF881 domain-containing protein [Alloscardovia macacae]OTA27540.1 hypothetical protein B9G54_00245 [Alloscardovia macacae]OTA30188.1 hypothetical protein B9T39_00325 [Alloscardovia macacae]
MAEENEKEADSTQTGVFPVVEKPRKLSRAASSTISSWSEFLRELRHNRHTRSLVSSLILIALGAGVGYAFMAQQRITNTSYDALSESELVTLLDETNNQITRLETQRTQLSQQLDSIQTANNKQQEIERIAQENKDANDILSGSTAAYGPGIQVTISQGTKKDVSAASLFTVIEELRNAGAEVIQIGDVRVVTSTYVTDTKTGLVSDGVLLEAPYVVKAIGDKTALQNAIDISGGVGSSLRVNYGSTVTVVQKSKVDITALAHSFEYKYAQTVE